MYCDIDLDLFCQVGAPPEDIESAPGRRRKPRERRRNTPPPTAPPALLGAPAPTARYSMEDVTMALRPYALSPQRMWALGYPMELEPNSSKAVVYMNPPPRSRPFTALDANAPEFVPGGSPADSGRGSGGSSPRSDSDEEADADEHICVRCDSRFRIGRDGEYLTRENCLFHWGRLAADGREYQCCGASAGARGCSTARLHVWNGTRPGMNGPLDGYVRARSRRGGVYAMDAEMCYTTAGLELASVAVVAPDGRVVYRSLVKPTACVIDFNTRFSGIRSRDLARATKTLRDVQNDILGFVGVDTVLVGHSLDNDLRALKLLHGLVVDTCALYPHARGWPLRRSLRSLAGEHLLRHVQEAAHSPVEDARAAMDLVLLKMRQDGALRLRPSAPVYLQPYDPLLSAA